jgi:hypothetical protein
MELGQYVSGREPASFQCPSFVEAGLQYLACRIEAQARNQTQEPYNAPTGNNGAECSTGIFDMRAYCWNEESPKASLPNFHCRDFKVYWYKYLGRGMTMNKDIDANEFFEIIDDCIDSLHNLELL